MPTSCYLLERTNVARRWLRRYVRDHEGGYTCEEGWHEAREPIADATVTFSDEGTYREGAAEEFEGDPQWPTHCGEGCGYEFRPEDHWQVFTRLVYRVTFTVDGAALQVGAETTLENALPGAMWYADWMGAWAQGPDGRTLVVKLPDGHDWMVDAEATNCTRKGDRTHRCWVRRGSPPHVTVDKNGDTCAAGAGSIASTGYHGFLQDGVLT